jgi:hypothetical protein
MRANLGRVVLYTGIDYHKGGLKGRAKGVMSQLATTPGSVSGTRGESITEIG